MKILVTGAGGFIGNHLVEALLQQGHHVTALCRYTSNQNLGWLTDHPKLTVVLSDICDPDALWDYTDGIDVIYHLAALISIPHSYVMPFSYSRVNLMGTQCILDCAQKRECRVVLTSTSEIYGSNTNGVLPMAEDHPIRPQSPYAASKVAADAMGRAYHLSYGVDVVTVRPFNTYGPRQSTRAVIAKIASQIAKGGPIELGDLRPRRDFLYVTDTARGFIAAGTHGVSGEVYNLATGETISIGEVVDMLNGGQYEVKCSKEHMRPAASEVTCLCGDASKARAKLDWYPQVTLEEGLQSVKRYFGA